MRPCSRSGSLVASSTQSSMVRAVGERDLDEAGSEALGQLGRGFEPVVVVDDAPR